MTKPKIPSKKVLLPLLLILIIVLALGGFLAFNKLKSSNTSTSDNSTQQVNDLQAKVGKLIALPTDETPTVATVSDINKLKGQPFFARAVNGDKVLIYQDAKKAILYRPSENKIIEVAVYNPAQASQNGPTPSITNAKVRVVIFNGTKTAGLAKKEQDALTSKYPNINVIDTGNAASDYKKDLIVDLTGKNAAFAKTLASDLGGEVGKLPDTEANPDADIVIFLGAAE